ncbi:hypothetical protein [Candidatus Electronema sp. PJ]|uniref:hypothetical protein n=1 Tax=Candidatus Electronema sp. PJ TaxID=3401572 RepID=UPI003AA97AD1
MKPNDFYVGIIHFFAILVPGSIASALLVQELHREFFFMFSVVLQHQAAVWISFLICSYFIGHLIFLVGSWLDMLHDRIRKSLYNYCQNDQNLLAGVFNGILKLKANQAAYERLEAIRDTFLQAAKTGAMNPIQWGKAVLLMKHPAALDEVNRLEADSKFFRSMVVVCLLAAALFSCSTNCHCSSPALLVAALCYIRYAERRIKSDSHTAFYIITMESIGSLKPPSPQTSA